MPIVIAGKKSIVKELAQEVEADSKKLLDNITDEEKKKIKDKQDLLNIYYDILNTILGSYDLEAPLTEEEKAKIDNYLNFYAMAKCTDRELFRPIRYVE